MAGLDISDILLIRERIIVTIKRNGELTDSGHRMRYTEFQPALLKDEIISSNKKLRKADYSPKSLLSYFEGQEDIKIYFQKDPPKHWIHFALKRVIKSTEIMDAARRTIQEIKARNGIAADEEFHISSRELGSEFSRTIPFYELYLKSNKMTLKDFVKELDINGSNKGSSSEDKKTGDKEGKQQDKKQTKSVTESTKEESIESSDKTDDERIISTIASIIETQGEKHNGISRITMGKLCVKLTENRLLMLDIRKKGKGTTRDCLINCFGKALEIETIDGIEWVSIPQTGTDAKAGSVTEQKSNEPELSVEEAENRVRKEILSILEQQGTVSGGYRQMVLGMLCNALADSSAAYQVARGTFKGPARSFLLDRFGDLLTIEYIDGKDWARVPLSAFGEKKEQQKIETPKEKPAPEAEPALAAEPSPLEGSAVPEVESVSSAKAEKATKTTKTATKKKEAATELLIHELIDLSDEELNQLLLVVRLVHETSGDTAVKPSKKKTEYAADKNETSAVVAIAGKVGLNAQAVLAKNETMNKITALLTTGEIIEIITEEIRMRKGVSVELPETEADRKAGDENKDIPQYKPEIMTDADYEGLDDWLPF